MTWPTLCSCTNATGSIGLRASSKGSDANRTLFHMRDQKKLRQAFAVRDEGADRNAWLYSYNPLTVTLT